MNAKAESGAKALPYPDNWVMGDITVDENGTPHTYRYSMLLCFKSVEDFRAARQFFNDAYSPNAEGKR